MRLDRTRLLFGGETLDLFAGHPELSALSKSPP